MMHEPSEIRDLTDRQLVEEMLEWFADGEHWIQGRTGQCSLDGKPAKSCLGGAFGVVLEGRPAATLGWGDARDAWHPVVRAIREVIAEQFSDRVREGEGLSYVNFPVFNDHGDTTIADIRLVLEKTLTRLED